MDSLSLIGESKIRRAYQNRGELFKDGVLGAPIQEVGRSGLR